ncbi:MAG: hypothetical protein H7329_01825 [Opitutaceae bacterium]|nr:hypothetical protein [Cytophagales bacterium]
MHSKTYISASSIFTPFGLGTEINWQRMNAGESAIKLTNSENIRLKNFFSSSISEELFLKHTSFLNDSGLTRLEKMMVATIANIQDKTFIDLSDKSTIFVFSTTKGNIDLLVENPDDIRLSLPSMAQAVSTFFKNPNTSLVISNACISGISAMILAKNMLEEGEFEQAIVCGGDTLSEFTVSGFNSLNAISPFPCRPFDKSRLGLSPGEGCGVLVLSRQKPDLDRPVYISGAATSNDANHISGPSRTGEGLNIAIEKAIKLAKIDKKDIGYINAHGTATLYNDESEGLAITLSGLQEANLHSLKGYLGHTYGAAGLIESAIAAECFYKKEILGSIGYSEHGISVPLNISQYNKALRTSHALKTASGFGGCNAALILSTDD